jgi:hypothetical protein
MEGNKAIVLLLSMWYTHWFRVVTKTMLKGRMFSNYQKWDTPFSLICLLYCSDLKGSLFPLIPQGFLLVQENVHLGK